MSANSEEKKLCSYSSFVVIWPPSPIEMWERALKSRRESAYI